MIQVWEFELELHLKYGLDKVLIVFELGVQIFASSLGED